MTHVRSVMRAHPWTVEEQAPIRKAIELMDEGGIRHLPVMGDGHVVGIVSDRDLRGSRSDLNAARRHEASPEAEQALERPISTLMARTVISVSPQTPLAEAVHLLREHVIGALPVIDDGQLVGIVSSIDLLSYFGEAAAANGQARCVADLMTEHVFSVLPTDHLDVAMAVMLDHGVRHAPVVDEDGVVVGIVSHRDLLGATVARTKIDRDGNLVELLRALTTQTVAEIMHTPETVEPETLLSDAAELLIENAIGCVPVVENQRLVGILTESDFVRIVASG